MPPRPFCALVALSLAVAPGALAASGEGQVLVQQGQKYEREGKPDVALELYRAALLVEPNEAETHRLVAELLVKKERCGEAVPEYRSFLQLAPAASRQGAGWEQAVVNLAACLRAEQAHVEVRPTADGRCGLDGGPQVAVVQGRPLVFDVAPGEHTLQCARGEQQAPPLVVSLAGRETRSVVADLASLGAPPPAQAAASPAAQPAAPVADPAAPAVLRLRSDLAALCLLDGATSLAVASDWAEREIPAGPHHLECTCTGNAPFVKDVRLEAGAKAELILPYALNDAPLLPPADAPLLPPDDAPPAAIVGGVVAPPAAPPPPPVVVAPTPPPVWTNAASVRVQLDSPGWTCTVDQSPRLTPDEHQVVLLDMAPGQHYVRCSKPGARTFEKAVMLVRGERVELRPEGGAPKTNPTPDRKPDPKVEQVAAGAPGQPGEVAPRPDDALEWGFQGGFGAGLGTFGLGLSARVRHWALQLGSGLYPFALSATYYDKPGQTGYYVNAGYMRVAEGLFAGGSTVSGHGLFASTGLQVQADRALAVRVGLGLGYNSTGLSSGPFTFDLSMVYAP